MLPINSEPGPAGQRAQAGRIVPKGFPRSNRFGPGF
jgi:hypothetical protein